MLDRTGSKLWRESAQRCRNVRVRGYATQGQCPRDSGPSHHSSSKSREQSQNVVENKESRSSESSSQGVGKPKQAAEGRTPTVCHSSTLNSGLLDSNSTEQSQNVYENKGSAGKSTTPGPSLSKEGNRGLPSSVEEGLGVVRLCVLGVLCALARNRLEALKTAEQSQNVYENKESRSSEVKKSKPNQDGLGRAATICHSSTLNSRLLDSTI